MGAMAAGYSLRGFVDRASWESKNEDLFAGPSFSEVENARSTLNDLCVELVSEVVSKHAVPAFRAGRRDRTHVANAVSQLRGLILQFKGTDQELWIAHKLLWVLNRDEAHHEWLDLYLKLLYEQPTKEIDSRLALQAAVAAKKTGREAELLRAFAHLKEIPFDFPGKEKITTADAGGVLPAVSPNKLVN
jgi:hypothetical protein